MNDIISQFVLANAVQAPVPVKVGFINDSFMLPSAVAGGKSYFLQRINDNVFRDVEGLQRNIQIVTDHIRKKLQETGESDIERKVLQLVPTHDGKLYYCKKDGDDVQYWRIRSYRQLSLHRQSDPGVCRVGRRSLRSVSDVAVRPAV